MVTSTITLLSTIYRGNIKWIIHRFWATCRKLLDKNRLDFNPLNPNIKIQILIYYPYTFSIEVLGRIC